MVGSKSYEDDDRKTNLRRDAQVSQRNFDTYDFPFSNTQNFFEASLPIFPTLTRQGTYRRNKYQNVESDSIPIIGENFMRIGKSSRGRKTFQQSQDIPSTPQPQQQSQTFPQTQPPPTSAMDRRPNPAPATQLPVRPREELLEQEWSAFKVNYSRLIVN